MGANFVPFPHLALDRRSHLRSVGFSVGTFHGMKVSVAKLKEVLNNYQFSLMGLILEASRFKPSRSIQLNR